jgi:hypothetical protein
MSAVQDVLDKYGEKLVIRIRKKLVENKKFATGNLVNSIDYKYSMTNNQYRIQITGLPYLINVDRGRRAGAKPPPVKAIEAWIIVKRIRVTPKMKPTSVLSQQQNKKVALESARRGMAYAIAKNISKRGIKPFPILNEANVLLKSAAFKNDIAAALKKDVAPVILKIFNKN